MDGPVQHMIAPLHPPEMHQEAQSATWVQVGQRSGRHTAAHLMRRPGRWAILRGHAAPLILVHAVHQQIVVHFHVPVH